jgi:hypothetical protein
MLMKEVAVEIEFSLETKLESWKKNENLYWYFSSAPMIAQFIFKPESLLESFLLK